MKRLLPLFLSLLCAPAAWAQAARPNIVWLVLDDASPNLGCYGDSFARTPNMDRLAREGMRFTSAFTHAPVCAPSRSGLITGMYPTAIGSMHMRSQLVNPPETFTALLRAAGYHVVWPGKTDFNFAPPEGAATANYAPAGAFDSKKDWVAEGLPAERPFFAFLNIGVTHEGMIRSAPEQFAKLTARLKPEERHDPAKVFVPPYYPDAPEVRKDLAHYYDLMTAADYIIGDILRTLDERKLAGNTIVFLFSDHGRGMPRAKRWIYDSGMRVPLIVRWPGHIKPRGVNDDLISFIDFAPTILRLAGAEVPARMQGQVFLGPEAKRRRYIFAARDRMDETFDRIRAARDKRFKYIRNFHPELPYAQRIATNEQSPTMQAWRRLNAAGQLTGAAKLFFALAKPPEELYDTAADPFEVRNLAGDPKYQAKLRELRGQLDKWIVETGDLGEVSERELIRRGIVRDLLREYEKRRVAESGPLAKP